jgi:hypothetical protein
MKMRVVVVVGLDPAHEIGEGSEEGDEYVSDDEGSDDNSHGQQAEIIVKGMMMIGLKVVVSS